MATVAGEPKPASDGSPKAEMWLGRPPLPSASLARAESLPVQQQVTFEHSAIHRCFKLKWKYATCTDKWALSEWK